MIHLCFHCAGPVSLFIRRAVIAVIGQPLPTNQDDPGLNRFFAESQQGDDDVPSSSCQPDDRGWRLIKDSHTIYLPTVIQPNFPGSLAPNGSFGSVFPPPASYLGLIAEGRSGSGRFIYEPYGGNGKLLIPGHHQQGRYVSLLSRRTGGKANMTKRWPYYQQDPDAYRQHMSDYFYFFIAGVKEPLGYVHHDTVRGMVFPPELWHIDHEKRFLTLSGEAGDVLETTRQLQATLKQNFDEGRVIRKWRNENMPVYDRHGQHILDMDVCGIDLFGIVSYGVHLTAYVCTQGGYKYWVPRRSYTKSTFPGMLDNFVAGNLQSGESLLEGMIREVVEETDLPEDFARANIRSCGTVTYQMSEANDGRPSCQHHCQFVFEIEMPAELVPRGNDGEVESFTLMSLSEVQQALSGDEFTPNRTLTYIAHFIRHGIVNHENEPRLMEVCSRLHRKHDLFVA